MNPLNISLLLLLLLQSCVGSSFESTSPTTGFPNASPTDSQTEAPTRTQIQTPPPPSTRPPSSGSFSELEALQLASVAAAAYCDSARRQILQSWACLPCKKYPGVVFRELIYNQKTETFGFIATRGNTMIVAFRGTVRTEEENIVSNIQLWRSSPYAEFPHVAVHSGFWNSFNSVRTTVMRAIQKVNDSLEGKVDEIIFTGHSLGGALASLAAFEYTRNSSKNEKKVPLKLVTFGSPRVGEGDFVSELSKRLSTSWRITNWKDPVVQVPGRRFGFRHLPGEVFYSSSMTNYTICADSRDENFSCSNQFSTIELFKSSNLRDHFFYYNIRLGEDCNVI